MRPQHPVKSTSQDFASIAGVHYGTNFSSTASTELLMAINTNPSNQVDRSFNGNFSSLIFYYICSAQRHAQNRRQSFNHRYGFDAMKAFALIAGIPDPHVQSVAQTTVAARMRAYFSKLEAVARLVGGIWYQTYGKIAVTGAKQIFEELEAEAHAGFVSPQEYDKVPDNVMEMFRPGWKYFDASIVKDPDVVGNNDHKEEYIAGQHNDMANLKPANGQHQEEVPDTSCLFVMHADDKQMARACIAPPDQHKIISVASAGTKCKHFVVDFGTRKAAETALKRANGANSSVINSAGKHPRVEWYRGSGSAQKASHDGTSNAGNAVGASPISVNSSRCVVTEHAATASSSATSSLTMKREHTGCSPAMQNSPEQDASNVPQVDSGFTNPPTFPVAYLPLLGKCTSPRDVIGFGKKTEELGSKQCQRTVIASVCQNMNTHDLAHTMLKAHLAKVLLPAEEQAQTSHLVPQISFTQQSIKRLCVHMTFHEQSVADLKKYMAESLQGQVGLLETSKDEVLRLIVQANI
ncbi:hypothetical protein OHC33_000379 [Knufia fluminis]|uniref:RNA-binding domain-containing protein n=1 Tax=Knufia fluminis TaxID=191047 RepID=A0AAN8ICJ7_9EURO|nr:hypothetical protein OHC33_000379 [Knufia fluminis]